MLVARKYDLSDYEMQTRVKHLNEVNIKKKKTKKQRINSNQKYISIIALFFILGFIIVLRHVNLTEMSNNIDLQKEQISSLEKTNSQLRTETVVDLDKVDQIAKEKLNMDRPYKYQMVYINLNENNKLDSEKANTGVESGYKIVKSINKVVEYFY